MAAVREQRIEQTGLAGCLQLFPRASRDARGWFVKTFHEEQFAAAGLATHFAEEYYSVSRRNVLRGLHFQTPPRDHAKLVYCTAGAVLDVVVDLRAGSPTFGQHRRFTLTGVKRNALYIPTGFAHGFYVTRGPATMIYKTTTVHSPAHDAGVLWSSCGIRWPARKPLVSERDRAFPALDDFASPFVFRP
jgi:dTDP-4-dehydrorhamnose 3,5-epimerase